MDVPGQPGAPPKFVHESLGWPSKLHMAGMTALLPRVNLERLMNAGRGDHEVLCSREDVSAVPETVLSGIDRWALLVDSIKEMPAAAPGTGRHRLPTVVAPPRNKQRERVRSPKGPIEVDDQQVVASEGAPE